MEEKRPLCSTSPKWRRSSERKRGGEFRTTHKEVRKHGEEGSGSDQVAVTGGKATPAPPVGPALGQHGVNIMEFCKRFNAETADKAGMILPVVITVYEDKSFTFIIKTPLRLFS